MNKKIEESKRINKITNIVAYITLTLFTILQIGVTKSLIDRMISICLILSFSFLWIFWFPKIKNSKVLKNLFVFVETLIILTPLFLNINWGIFPYIFFVLSVFAMIELSFKNGLLWILTFSIICLIVFTKQLGLYEGFLYSLLYGVGSFFFGGFGYALSLAIESREKSEKLLSELKDANEKLKEYASKVEQLAILEERNRLSREMHDSIGHHLVTVSLQIEILKKVIDEKPNEAKKLIEIIKNEIRKSLEDLRNVVKTLRKPLEFDIPLEESIKNLVESYSSIKNIKTNLEIDENLIDLPEDYKITLFRVCQEALTNIEKHSKASEIWIKLKNMDDKIFLVVEDNGVGFPKNLNDNSFGLKGIKERASILNGEVKFENREEGGARIIFSLPVNIRRS
ncbi:MAG: sensor histidine kinase [Caldisericia bacterium]|nr:sensor histidine kinase [Caldisericia bacterium]